MRRLRKKKKGISLLEIVISIAILAIVSIPISGMILTSVKTNKSGEDKQKAALLGQQILEEIKVSTIREDGTNIIGNIELETKEEILTTNDDGTPKDIIRIYTSKNEAEDENGYLVSIKMVEDETLEFSEAVRKVETDANVYITYEDEASKGIGISTKEDKSDIKYIGHDMLSIINEIDGSGKYFMKLKRGYNDLFTINQTTTENGILDNDSSIKIVILDDEVYDKLNITIENNSSEPFSIYLEKDKITEKNTREIKIENTIGTIKRYNNVINEVPTEEEKIGSLYKVEVEVKKDSVTIFKGNGVKNIYEEN